MAIVYRQRQVTYVLLVIPVLAYLIVMTCIVTQFCPRSSPGQSELQDLQTKYQALVKILQERVVASGVAYSARRDNTGSDARTLLDSETRGKLEAFLRGQARDRAQNTYSRRKIVKNYIDRQSDEPPQVEKSGSNIHWRFDQTSEEQKVASDAINHRSDLDSGQHRHLTHNCSTISGMRVRYQIGHGVSKQAFLAVHEGRPVVIKMVTRHAQEVKWCLEKLRQAKIKNLAAMVGVQDKGDEQDILQQAVNEEDMAKNEVVQNNGYTDKKRLPYISDARVWPNNSRNTNAWEARLDAANINKLTADSRMKGNLYTAHRGSQSQPKIHASIATAQLGAGERSARESLGSLKTHKGEKPRGMNQVELTQSERQGCYTAPTARVMKEILLSLQLTHPNLASMLGYCVRSEESESTDISEHGVISVFELGSRFILDNLQILPWQSRLRHATEMASLLHYLEFSPIGSLVVPDLKEGHLVMVNDSLKLIDLDDVNNLEPECGPHRKPKDTCPYGLRCSRALCEGFNAKENMKNMNLLVFKRLLFPTTFPSHIVPDIGQLNADLDSLKLTAGELFAKLRELQDRAVSLE
ncbi:protein kinase domain-containing protein, cytoplasmic [Plakobranchus ocellatus]|uniref:Protein kinase domain-containing protein, cytoplasmic n=1 Tax=Plakobranchus ocellatus TaxID=259542 RepID=A0AAV3YTL2_9GAST|nr:protein kinase domain-containing protein, cytoplasmic [Plakobranchus ocellatus]